MSDLEIFKRKLIKAIGTEVIQKYQMEFSEYHCYRMESGRKTTLKAQAFFWDDSFGSATDQSFSITYGEIAKPFLVFKNEGFVISTIASDRKHRKLIRSADELEDFVRSPILNGSLSV